MFRPGSLSLERKLPLLISLLLVALATGLTVAGYHEVRRATEARGIDGLQRVASQLAELAGTSTEARLVALRKVAADSAVVAHLAAPEPDATKRAAALTALNTLALTPADTPIVAELRSTSEATSIVTRPELAKDDEPISSLLTALSQGQAAMGALYSRGDSVFFWVGAPVTGSGRVLGYVLQRRPINSNPRAERTIRDLNGSDSVSIYFATEGSARWASLSGKPADVPVITPRRDDPPNVIRYLRGGSSEYIAVYAHVPNTPLRVIAEMPRVTLLERPNAYLGRSAGVAVLMVVIGIICAWILSRRITRPLVQLTAAADAISTGKYTHRAEVRTRDEAGRLADAFNTMAEQVQRSHDDLERQIAESRTLAARLDEANRAKADFLATMSHELRTPLNAIGGYVDLIELGVRGPVTEDQRRDLERVRHNQRHLLALIGNILDFTRLDAQKLPFDIGVVRVDCAVTQVLTSMAPLFDDKQLRRECVGCDVPISTCADAGRVDQILLNLLSNAVRFTPSGGMITVAVSQLEDEVAIAVQDTGIGIPPEKLGVIFEPFVQVESGLTRTVGGTGLGLTISKGLARAMGGNLVAESDGATYARFTLTLPLVRSDNGSAKLAGASAAV
ncbi:MAG TPA: ATP-binding protein [Gemmatimonadaceae bacterium]|nr:ATP-binding protein [Gemmatimonadaceae bacterium]